MQLEGNLNGYRASLHPVTARAGFYPISIGVLDHRCLLGVFVVVNEMLSGYCLFLFPRFL